MEEITFFVDVILPLALPQHYTYRVPRGWESLIQTGQRVTVQFGKNKLYAALIRNIHNTPPRSYEAKYLENILDDVPVVNELQFKFWDWIAEYYMCTTGDVMNAALPSGLKLSSESLLILNNEFDDPASLNDKEFLILEALQLQHCVTILQCSEILQQKNVYPVLKSLIEKRAVLLKEEVKVRYKPKTETFIKLSDEYKNEDALKALFDKLEKKAPKQLEAVMAYIHNSQSVKDNEGIKKSLLNKQDAAVNSLIKKGIFETVTSEVSRLNYSDSEKLSAKELSEAQKNAYHDIKNNFEEKEVVLLHGVTSSGKTEIYIKLIEEAISTGKQALYMLPEIALTAQIITRLKKHFGNKVGVYHSKFSDNERVEIWNNLINSHTENSYKVILGTRSSLLLPYSNLGLIIIDEEHENTYKQYEPAPRYHARDAAIVFAGMNKAKVLLGSATPALESYYNAKAGKYGLVILNSRYGDVQLPEIIPVDIKEESRKKIMKSHFSQFLLTEIEAALKNKEQVILFQNRRGYAPMLNCNVCGWTPKCTNCDVSLTYHKGRNSLNCHYCGYKRKLPNECEACGTADIKMKGFGTEKIEDELSIYLPDAKVARLDLDTTRAKNAYPELIENFEEKKIDILVGTQMVTKGLDFDNVTLVGILNADSMLTFPDFRAYERSYQLMAQVSGRAGRKQKRGRVVIQTFNPANKIIRCVIDNDYEKMYREELAERESFLYPPFFRLIQINLKHKEINKVQDSSITLSKMLKNYFGKAVLGPEFPAIARIRNYYNMNILLKIDKKFSALKVKTQLRETISEFAKDKNHKQVRVTIDVDPA